MSLLHPGSLAHRSETLNADHPFHLLLRLREVRWLLQGHTASPPQKQNSHSGLPATSSPPCFFSLPTARGLEHHRALGQRQLPGHPAGGHLPLPHLALLLRLRQCRLQELQQQRDPGELAWNPRKRKGNDRVACFESSKCWVWGRLALGSRLLVSESGLLLEFSQP